MTDAFGSKVTVSGGFSAELTGAPLGSRALAALFDLVLIPIVLGVVFGLLFFAASDSLRGFVLVFVNMAWTCLRDIKGGAGPGKRMAKIKVVDAVTGENPTLGKHILRNLLLCIPFVLFIGYIVELIMIFIVKKDRVSDQFAKCKVVVAQ